MSPPSRENQFRDLSILRFWVFTKITSVFMDSLASASAPQGGLKRFIEQARSSAHRCAGRRMGPAGRALPGAGGRTLGSELTHHSQKYPCLHIILLISVCARQPGTWKHSKILEALPCGQRGRGGSNPPPRPGPGARQINSFPGLVLK